MRGAVVEGTDRVEVARGTARLRARRRRDGAVEVAVWGGASPDWRPVDGDLVGLTRAASRLVTWGIDDARRFATAAQRLAGARVSDPNPVTGLVRAAYPLLAGDGRGRGPATPDALPPWLQPAFREASPRVALRQVLGPAATRPVVRAFCSALTGGGRADLFPLSLAVAAKETLAPDHLVALLEVEAPGADPAALDGPAVDALTTLVAGPPPERIRRWLLDAAADARARERLRFVLASPPPVGVDPTRLDLRELAAASLRGAAPTSLRTPVDVAESGRFHLVPVRTVARLRQLATMMHNCLAAYADRLRTPHAIVEVREAEVVRYVVHLRAGRIVTFEGPNNRPPAPDDVPEVERLLALADLHDPRSGTVAGTPPRGERRRPSEADGAVSLSWLAADLLGPPSFHRTDWTELAAALWVATELLALPEPDDRLAPAVVADLAGDIVAGRLRLAPGQCRPATERHAARRELLAGRRPGTAGAWRRTWMADVVVRPVRD